VLECPNCHFENPDNTKFCGNCATPLPLSGETLDSPTETLEAAVFMLKTSSVLSDRYEIIEEIGKGGMSRVYKALDREIDEKIALKLIRPEIASNKTLIQRFQNELKMARKISHKNVCRMLDIGKDGGSRFITMEYISGEDLKKSIRRMGPLTIRKTISVSKQVCHGLSEAHRLGVIHRDLKPHNIMIDREGSVRIMDFGIALSQETKGITDPNIMIGTPQYLSPEQVEGKKADKRSDIYSLGVIMFEMVTGQVPFDGETTLSIAVKHKTEIPRDPREFNVQVSEELSQLILRCLEKDPDKRYQTAEELCAGLTTIEQNLPTKETTISRVDLGKKARVLSRNTKNAAAIFLAVVVIAVVAYFLFNLFLEKDKPSGRQLGVKKWTNSIVVLPFRDLSPEKDQNPLNLLLMDTLIVNLHSFRELRVIPTKSAQMYQDSKKDIKTIGDELNVKNVLEGTMFRSGDELRITAQLSNVKNESIIWAEIFEGSQDELMDLQADIVKATAEALGVEHVDKRLEAVSTQVSPTLLANKFYSRARHFEISLYHTRSERDFEICVENYLKVLDSYPNDTMTYWRLGQVHEQRYHQTLDKKYLNSMFQYFKKAYDINPNFALANIGLGWSYYYQEDNDRAFQYFKKAYEIDPDNAEVNFHLGSFYTSIGLWEAGLSRYSRAIELDPMPLNFVIWYNLRAKCYGFLGRFEEAVKHIEAAIEIQPDLTFYFSYTWQLIMLKRYEEADKQISTMKRLAPDSNEVRLYEAWLCAAKGNRERALSLIQGDKERYTYLFSNIYALLGMKDEAIDNIKRGIEISFEKSQSYYYPYSYIKNNPCLDVLRDDPRFMKIMNDQKRKYDLIFERFSDLES
jgi:serine/threonine protein kinase/Tfp pilus assembly protein PilF